MIYILIWLEISGSTDATNFGFKLYNHSWWSACSNSCTTFQTDVQVV